jgi:hypothetical protein
MVCLETDDDKAIAPGFFSSSSDSNRCLPSLSDFLTRHVLRLASTLTEQCQCAVASGQLRGGAT